MAGFDELAIMEIMGAVEEAEIHANHDRRVYKPQDPLNELSNQNFGKLYRLTKNTTDYLINLLEPHLQAPTRVSAMSIERKVLTALIFFASESYQTDIGCQINHAVTPPKHSRNYCNTKRVL
ncbi:hypothetical protein JTB14_031852 [Gonioctena quinquepunctata]|nr:hypothetical protein JTB14_031852 [Gonioctena quinquepunctata]